MSVDTLKGQISQASMNNIKKYLYVRNNGFIVSQMMRLSSAVYFNARQWRFLIRDSKQMKIEMPLHELEGRNFADFIENIIKRPESMGVGVAYIQQFCMQAIINNPQLMLCRYYVGNGGSPIFQMMASFLINRSVNGITQWAFPQIYPVLYKMLCYILQIKYFDDKQMKKFCYALQFHTSLTPKTVETVDLILKNYDQLIFKRHYRQKWIHSGRECPIKLDNRWQYDEWCYEWDMQRLFFASLFQNYAGQLSKWNGEPRTYITEEQYKDLYYPTLKQTTYQILVILDKKYPQIIQYYAQSISKILFSINQPQVWITLLSLPNFKSIIFGKYIIFAVFTNRNQKICNLLWSFVDERDKICGLKLNGKNLLQTICENRGLTHNIIDMLWGWGKFTKMPLIRNKKSQEIIKKKYKIGNESVGI